MPVIEGVLALSLSALVILLVFRLVVAIVFPPNHFWRIVRLALAGLIIWGSLAETFWAIPAYLLIIWLFVGFNSKVETNKLKPTIAKVRSKDDLRYHEVLLGHRLLFLFLFIFLAGVFLETWDLYNLENSRWVWWGLAIFVVFRGLNTLVDNVISRIKEGKVKWRKRVFVVAVFFLADGALGLSEHIPSNDFFGYAASGMVFAGAIFALAHDAYPRAIKYCATKLEVSGFIRPLYKARDLLIKLYMA